MSKEFIESQYNSRDIRKAALQEKHLDYFINSELQESNVDSNYLRGWMERNYQSNDYFLNWIKLIFKSDNFLLFFKYLRYPLPSTKLIKNKIEPQLRRVFKAEDSNFKYSVNNKSTDDFIEDLDIKEFNSKVFQRLLYQHNSLIVSDLKDVNKPFRYFIDIDKVVSITESESGDVDRIAYTGSIVYEGEPVDGIVYIDSERYAFYNKDKELLVEEGHDLGYTPVHFITPNRYKNSFVVRESIYTFIRNDIEEYVFLKTLQKMTEPNGAIPIVTKIETQDSDDNDNPNSGEPNSDGIMGSATQKVFSQNSSIGGGDLQPGTIHEVPIDALMDENGNINTDAVVNYLNFHYTPIEALEYLNTRIIEVEQSIVVTIAGDIITGSEEAKNIPQIEKSIAVLENTLISLAEKLNKVRKDSDTDMLALKYGKDAVNEVFIHYGTDFFLDSESKLFDDLKKAPNSLERKNIIVRINQNRYKNNEDFLSRQKLLYDLMPYVTDTDFNTALSQGIVSDINKEYQIRFTYWIAAFEAQYGDVVVFYKEIEGTKSQKLILINNLIIDIIKLNMNDQSVKENEAEEENN